MEEKYQFQTNSILDAFLLRHYIFLCWQIFAFQIVVVFYVAIVLLLIGTNLRAGGAGRSARFKKHVVEFTEVTANYLMYIIL